MSSFIIFRPDILWKVPTAYLRDARAIQKKTGRPQLLQAVIYNLPDRDCSAKASDGELHIDDAGEARYEAFIKSIYSTLQRFPDVATVLILEPDSIGNGELVCSVHTPRGSWPYQW